MSGTADGSRSTNAVRLCAALSCLSLLLPSGAQARDRPGTPVNQILWSCYGAFARPRSLTEGPPSICVKFTNTANENVTFEVVVTANGQRMDVPWMRQHVTILDNMGSADGISQTVGQSITTRRPQFIKRRNSAGRFSLEGFTLYNLALDTTYCVFIKAKTDGNIVSGQWSQSPCVRTRR